MNPSQARSLLSICLRAAFADGGTSEAERTQIKQILEGLSQPDFNLAALYQEVLLNRTDPQEILTTLDTPELRQLAYEMALCTCESDGALNAAETAHLAGLRTALGLGSAAAQIQTQVATLGSAPFLQDGAPPIIQRNASAAPASSPVSIQPQSAPLPADGELDRSILNYSILNGALELLPDSMATMAIIPLQMKMVYEIGQRYGFSLDRGHIKEFVAAAGVGLTSQVLEGYASKLAKGLLGRVAGGFGRLLAGQATSSAMSFATTYALGQLARRYYAGGRTLTGIQLKELFSGLLGEAQRVQAQHLPAIEARSRTLTRASLLELARHA